MIRLERVGSDNSDFIRLVTELDAYVTAMDGEEHAFYAQFNHLDSIRYVVIAYENNQAIGCGAIKEFDRQTMEIKRMYTLPEVRGKGVASKILFELEKWATELKYQRCILETGKSYVHAIALYKKCGYTLTDNYGQYIDMDNSVCFAKHLTETSIT